MRQIMRNRRRAQGGFTLLDLLVAVTAFSVMLLDAAPLLGVFANTARLARISDGLASQIDLAQSEAIRRNVRVVLCKSGDGASCAATGGWEQGWIVFHDANGNGAVDAGETVIARQHALPPAIKLKGDLRAASYVSFASGGMVLPPIEGTGSAIFTLCRQWNTGNEARQIILNAVGQPRVEKLRIDSCA